MKMGRVQQTKYMKARNLVIVKLTSGGGGGPSSNILLKIGIKKAAVFPEPTTEST